MGATIEQIGKRYDALRADYVRLRDGRLFARTLFITERIRLAQSMGVIAGRAIGYLLLGAVAAPLLMLVAMIPIYVFDSRCGTPGDSGGCEMSIAVNMIMSVLPGAVIGLIIGLWRGVKAKNRLAVIPRESGESSNQ